MRESRMRELFFSSCITFSFEADKGRKSTMKTNLIKEKTFEFSKEIVFLYHFLVRDKH